MCRISIVANNESLAHDIAQALPENVDCRIFSFSEAEQQSPHGDFFPSDLLILDFESTEQSALRFLANLSYIHPETIIVVIVATENLHAAEALAPFDIDEIIIRPITAEQRYRMFERILQRIAHLDCLQKVQEKLRQEMNLSQIVAKSKPMREIMQRLSQLANCTSTVLITGETGTGKELFAQAVHYLGPRAGQPFITVDCGTMPDHLVENELFGHVRGAYTDANSASKGLIQEAEGGTLFLDEVEALPLGVQTKFLRFLQERQYKPLGQSKYISVNVRVVAASNINLIKAVANKTFREDLYYRLNVVPLFLPPLRERKADIPTLVRFFLHRHNRDHQAPMQIPAEILRSWMGYDWPGNVRELENKVQQWLAMAATNSQPEAFSMADSIGKPIRTLAEARQEALAQFERLYLQNLLTHTKGNISAAARLAGTDRKHLRGMLKKHGITANSCR